MSSSLPAAANVATGSLSSRPPPNAPALVVLSGMARGRKMRLTGRLRIGKATDNDLVLPDACVSRYHCEIEPDPAGLLVRDLNSTNHTRIDSSKIQQGTLEPGATLTIGDVQLRLAVDAQRAPLLPSESCHFGQAVGKSLAMRQVFGLLERVAATDATVLLGGETGTGKEVLARSIHDQSPRKAEPFMVVDCGAISYSLIESEFFGHERGAFTGAVQARPGAFEMAGAGTLFLDEIGELPLDVQPKLLRVLETREFRRVGGNDTRRCRARVLAASKRDLESEVERGKFREDLYFRLAVVPVTVPALRTRREDIPALVHRFIEQAKLRDPKLSHVTLSGSASSALMAHDWPGNVRELRNVIDRALYMAALSDDPNLDFVEMPMLSASHGSTWDFNPAASYRETRAGVEREFEKRYVSWLLARNDNNVSAAARSARMDRKHLHELVRRHGLKPS